MKKDFLHINDLSAEEIWDIFNLAEEVKNKFKMREEFKPFNDQSLAMIFVKPSTRTRISFETGYFWMGGHALYIGPADIDIGKREPVKDVARVVSRYNDMIMARLFDHDHIIELAEHATVPVINGLTDYNHPCQIMADMFTILEHRGNLDDLKIVYIGDGNNVVHSWLEMAAKLPLRFVCACPEGYTPDSNTFKLAADSGISQVEISHDPKTAVKNADILYTDVWASMGQKHESEERKKRFKGFQVNDDLIQSTGKETLFMHCLPAERGAEVTDSVIESKSSIVFDEAENRMHVQNAIMLKMAGIR